jgi:thioredoxin-related protein
MTRQGWAAALALLASFAAQAGLPAAYQAMVIQPSVSGERTEFDLTPALQRAQKEGKRLYVYLGANDCKFCRRYEAFLEKNAGELAPHFAEKYLVVDLRSSLMVTGSQLYVRAGSRSLAYPDFQRSIGDERARLLVYPNIWLFDAALKPLMQMPSGAGTFETVAEQIEVLQLVQ